ncbi:hypothetical protein DACRYDRAFT_106264 [Dacryopinax primogenitus]|uniref:Methyltransferase domain-containing protein n=1 Tax=Dacryopinax primogenitus (strain DJM 731) TaxID=1858805 RepID=M5G311_DACPD|nr:uncharacterized protein DACRYDRAFT_106264 [Dacryopinax primogenitus]EJU03089.1 hypothetical protein DACRYDRAFT_106264 [Dacryopinax primogenitus]
MFVERKAELILPSGFDNIESYAATLEEYLSSELVQSLLNGHPNEIAKSGPPLAWNEWWKWASSLNSGDIPLHLTESIKLDLPGSLSKLLRDASRLALPRASVPHIPLPRPLPKGQTPKKVHEVRHFSKLIAELSADIGVDNIVDVGSGQGYLSLELASKHGLNVLALDFSEVQTSGSIHWAQQAKEQNLKLSHVTHHISQATLPGLVQNWIDGRHLARSNRNVIVIGLHACGSLTVEVLRACMDNMKPQDDGAADHWKIKACAIVGCCYNMLSDHDKHVSRLTAPPLPSDAFQLAAQPWLPPSPAELSLTLKKITYRALFGRLLYEKDIELPTDTRVRRLKDSAYSNWGTYIQAASSRMGVSPQLLDINSVWTEEMRQLSTTVSMLHVLRSKLGPVIESWILLDRYVWLCEQLEEPGLASVEMKWVFDSGISARSAVFIVKVLHY